MARRGGPQSAVLEEGDLFFFYRPRIGVLEVSSLDDVQRLYMVTASKQRRGRKFRLFVIGRKTLPAIVPGRAERDERHWAIVAFTTADAEDIRRELSGWSYVTKTRGERFVAAAKPVGEARYDLVQHRDHSELAYVLELPERPGEAQGLFRIEKEASYVVAIRNPRAPQPPGIPAPGREPAYPKEVLARFGNRRWISVDDPTLLDYPYTQVLLLGAHVGASVERDLGIHLDAEHETANSAEVFRLLHLSAKEIPLDPLFRGKFPNREVRA
jgi:hypothetical protein